MPRIVKSDQSRQPLDEAKMRHGMLKALEKRPVGSEEIEAAVQRIVHALATQGEREIPAGQLGEAVMRELHSLDQVAYVRFASVYRSFQDVDAFREEIERLQHMPSAEMEREQMSLLPDENNKK